MFDEHACLILQADIRSIVGDGDMDVDISVEDQCVVLALDVAALLVEAAWRKPMNGYPRLRSVAPPCDDDDSTTNGVMHDDDDG